MGTSVSPPEIFSYRYRGPTVGGQVDTLPTSFQMFPQYFTESLRISFGFSSNSIQIIFYRYPNTTSSTIIKLNPNAKNKVPMFECFPADISGISSSTTT